jgi:hypothetical protein
VVVLDPGHNGGNWWAPATINSQVFIGNGAKACDTTGTSTSFGRSESACTFDVATRTKAILEVAGATVVLTRPDDNGVGPCITERAAIGNRSRAAVAVDPRGRWPAGGRGFHVIPRPRARLQRRRARPVVAFRGEAARLLQPGLLHPGVDLRRPQRPRLGEQLDTFADGVVTK